ncbi:MAG: DUF5666 domain-containing protein [Terracidiphilus sp.]
MKASRVAMPFFILLGALRLGAFAQDANPLQDPSQATPQRGQGRGRGGWGAGMMGRGVMGTVTEVAPDHFTIKTESGDLYTIHYSVNTRIMEGGGGQRRRQGSDNETPVTPPTTIKASDIKVGDAIGASGEMDANAKSIGAVVIFQIDPERAKQMREMQANYGKTWVMGRVAAISDVKVTLQGGPDNATHTFVADENTTFRKRRDPVTLADIQVGDMIRAEGSIKNGAFLATSVAVMGPPPQRNEGGAPAPPQ